MRQLVVIGAILVALTGCWKADTSRTQSSEPKRLLDEEAGRASEIADEVKRKTDMEARGNPQLRIPELNLGLGQKADETPSAPNASDNQEASAIEPEQKTELPQPGKPASAKKPKKPEPAVKQTEAAANNSLTLSELRAKYADFFKVSGTSREKKIALTFDDGPDETITPQVLDVLKRHNVKATFFVIGSQAEKYPAVVRRMIREGHVVGNHSYSHPLFTKLSGKAVAEDIEKTARVLSPLIGYNPRLLRPPYGAINEEQLMWARENRFVVVNWNVDSLDWKSLGAEQVTSNIMSHTKAGAIVLQHSGGGKGQDLSGTVQALPGIIKDLRSRGYQLVTVPELLHVGKQR